MFYLMMHSTHFIYGYLASDHSDSERGMLLEQHGLLLINREDSCICTIPQTGLHQLWRTAWNEKWLNGSTMRDWSDDPSHHEWMLYHGATPHSIILWKAYLRFRFGEGSRLLDNSGKTGVHGFVMQFVGETGKVLLKFAQTLIVVRHHG